MNETTPWARQATPVAAVAALLAALVGAPAQAQSQGSDATGAAAAASASPYYLGASQGLSHDSNVYRIPSGPGDYYSSTSLLAGFDQPISRQRVFGTASASLNRYRNETALNNTSYDLAAGLDWQTLYNLSGSVNATLGQRLAAPTASVAAPQAHRNLAQRQGVSGVARWGGVSLFTLEGTLGYSALDYSAPEYVGSESKQEYGGLALYYRQSPLLRLGVAARLDRARTPQAFLQPDGSYLPNQINGRHLDFLADYELSGRLNANGKISYTKQTNSSAGGADFSGITGDLGLTYRPTGKLVLSAYAARQAGFDTSLGATPVVPGGTTPATTPTAGLYENNRVTNSFRLGATYAATAKINVTGGLNYARARLVSTLATPTGSVGSPDVVDETQAYTLGVSYAIARPWLLACNLGHEKRDVSGGVSFAYEATSVGCSAQFTWR